MRSRLRSVLLGLLTVWALVRPGAAHAQAFPLLRATPAAGAVGTTVRVTGDGFPPLAGVFITLGRMAPDDGDCRDAPIVARPPAAFSDESGAFDLAVTVPRQPSSLVDAAALAPGPYCFLATSAPGLTRQAAFTLMPSPSGDTATCRFVLGFGLLRSSLPGQVGVCREDEQHNATSGDGLQHTSGGLLVWRKADNWTAFTDGYRTWVNGPFGLEERRNRQHFAWEGAGSGAGPELVAPRAAAHLGRFYALLDQGDDPAAYQLWHAPGQSLAAFTAGYADTPQVALRLGQPVADDAPGQIGVALPVVILARHSDNTTVAFAGCYTLATPRPQSPPAGPPPQPYTIVSARIQARPDIQGFHDAAALTALQTRCL